MRSFIAVGGIALVGLVTSCGSDPYATKIPINPKDWTGSKDLLNALENLPSEERHIVADYLNRSKNTTFHSGPATIGELIEAAAGRQRISDARDSENQKTLDMMSRILIPELTFYKTVEEVLVPGSSTVITVLHIAFENTGNAGLVESRGILEFKDKFGRPIVSIELLLDLEIPPESTRSIAFQLTNQVEPERLKPVGEVKTQWTPRSFIFNDGSSLSNPLIPPYAVDAKIRKIDHSLE